MAPGSLRTFSAMTARSAGGGLFAGPAAAEAPGFADGAAVLGFPAVLPAAGAVGVTVAGAGFDGPGGDFTFAAGAPGRMPVDWCPLVGAAGAVLR